MMKICGSCGKELDVSGFHRNRNKSDGFQSNCKSCARLALDAWRASNRERFLENGAAYRVANQERILQVRDAYKERGRLKSAAYVAANPERKKEMDAAYYAAHCDRIKQNTKAWAENNRDRHRENCKQWKRAHPEQSASDRAKRRAQQKMATVGWGNTFFIRESYRLAALRTKLTGIDWHVDHQVPINSPLVCGLHVEHNLKLLPAVVNVAKGNRFAP